VTWCRHPELAVAGRETELPGVHIAVARAASKGFDANQFMVNIGLALKVLSKGKKGTDSVSVVNFNALPETYRPQPIRLTNILVPVGIVVAGLLLVCLAYLGVMAHRKADDNSLLRSQVASAESIVTEREAKVAELTTQLEQVEASIPPVQDRANTLETTFTSLTANRQQLDGVLADIVGHLPSSMSLSMIDCQTASVTVTGTARM